MMLPSILVPREHITFVGKKNTGWNWPYARALYSSWAVSIELQTWIKDNNIDVYYDYLTAQNKIMIVFDSEESKALYLLRWK
jgi:hypothetical protein